MTGSLIQLNSGYRWVIIPKVLDFAAPEFWYSYWKEGTQDAPASLRIIKETEAVISVVEASPLNLNSKDWVFKGWIMPYSAGFHGGTKYDDISLEIEVLIASDKPMLSAHHTLDGELSPSGDPKSFFADTATETEYALGVLLESHSRATYLKYLLATVEKDTPNFKLNMVREDVKTITAFGDAFGGQWSLSLEENVVQNIYDAEFTFWRKANSNQKAARENNPNIAAEETQYFSGSIGSEPKILHFSSCLKDALNRYL